MTFHKTGIVPIDKIKCSCGHTITGHVDKCPQCGKTLIPKNLQTVTGKIPKKNNQEFNN